MDLWNQFKYQLLPKKTLSKEVKLRIIMISTYIEYGSF